LPLTTGVTGTLPTANGGTNLGGATPFTSGGVVYASSSSALATGSALTFNGSTLAITAATTAVAASFTRTSTGISSYILNGGATANFTSDTSANNAFVLTPSSNVASIVTNGIERMRIASATGGVGAVGIGYTSLTSVGDNGLAVLGNVGIGTSSPSATLDVRGTSPEIKLVATTGTNGVGYTVNNTGGNFYFGRDSNSGGYFGSGSAYSAVLWSTGAYPMVFATNNTERARITSAGDFLVGTTSTSVYTGNSLAYEPSGSYLVQNHATAKASGAAYTYFQHNGSEIGSVTQVDTTSIALNNVSRIKFPATQSASSDANTLDDYEEGTWTPTFVASGTNFTSITYDASTNGNYIKIGSLVYVTGWLMTDAVTAGSASGSLLIDGLPFTSASGSYKESSGSIGFSSAFTTNQPSSNFVSPNTTRLALYYRSTSNGSSTVLPVAALTNSADSNQIWFSASYRV